MSSDSEDSDFEDIREYFSASDWREMSDYEKGSYRSKKNNFHRMQQTGLSPKLPAFMRSKAKELEVKTHASKSFKFSKEDNFDEKNTDWSISNEKQAAKCTGSSHTKKFVAANVTRGGGKENGVNSTREAQESRGAAAAAAASKPPPGPAPDPQSSSQGSKRYPGRTGRRGKSNAEAPKGDEPRADGHLQDDPRPQGKDKTFSCSVCKATFRWKSELKRHLLTHLVQKPFCCDTCGKAFSDKSNLTVHMRVHNGAKPYSCDTCGKAFSVSTNLRLHKRIHDGEKPFSCSVCKATFSRKEQLQRHVLTHTREKPFSCDTCGKAFTQKCTLDAHSRTHSGEKPFTCDTCGKAFSQKSNLKAHERTHNGVKPYSCSVCEAAFSQSAMLKRHLRAKHRES